MTRSDGPFANCLASCQLPISNLPAGRLLIKLVSDVLKLTSNYGINLADDFYLVIRKAKYKYFVMKKIILSFLFFNAYPVFVQKRLPNKDCTIHTGEID